MSQRHFFLVLKCLSGSEFKIFIAYDPKELKKFVFFFNSTLLFSRVLSSSSPSSASSRCWRVDVKIELTIMHFVTHFDLVKVCFTLTLILRHIKYIRATVTWYQNCLFNLIFRTHFTTHSLSTVPSSILRSI